ncbi:hypothetical protein [Xanthomonas sp. NCPPB 2632]|uniref:hypothetical protein n=1 Tax=Xanthomonas sp. NCPPB 2632 TaxID=3240912 RepID=UPI003513A064
MRSVESVNAMLEAAQKNSPDDLYGSLYGTGLLSELQNLIVHAGALSRYLWAANPEHRWRGAELRGALQIADEHPLRNRDLRNAVEHFDEKLDDYLAGGLVGHIVPEYIGPMPTSNGVPLHLFRAYYVDTARFQLLDKSYEIQPIVTAVWDVHKKLLKMDQSGGMFGRGRT